jgi:glycosyltransferase involved in cell wall biosynthesis
VEKTRTSVVIAYRHADERLLKCLQAIEANNPDEIMALSGNLHYQDVQRGLENASGDIILFTDSDTYVPPDWISRHLKHYPEADMVLGWTAYNLPSLALRNFSAKRAFLLRYGFRSKRWKENFDTDLGLRLMEAKPKFVVDRSIRVIHDHPGGDRFGLRMKRKLRVGMMMLHRGYLPSLADISYFLQTPLEEL